MVKVTVPATSANIGPGFDTLGIALNLYNVYEFEELENGLIIEGCAEEYKNENNLVYKSFIKTAQILGYDIKGLKIQMETNIPVSRGLGSSSACIVGGVYGANALLNGNLSIDELFRISVELEGHPDNIAPAIYGGLTASITDRGVPYSTSYNVNDNVKFCALIPDFKTSTSEARRLLPEKVTFEDAVFNISRVAVLLKALETGDFNLIEKSIKDRLHQPYRKKLIKEFDKVYKICIDSKSSAVFISGSGPTIMNIINNNDFTNEIKNYIIKLDSKWDIKYLQIDKNGAVVETI